MIKLDRDRAPGQLLFTGIEGTSLNDETRKFLQKVQPGGIFIHDKNIESPEQLFDMCLDIKDRLYIPPFIAIDQEGGRVDKLRDFMPPFPCSYDVALTGDPEKAFKQGKLIGKALKLLGLNMDFAPVVDLSHPEADNAIGKRAYSTDADTTVLFAGKFLEGIKKTGVLSCLKHFPGLGPTFTDSHKTLPVVYNGLDELINDHIRVFKELLPLSDSVMIGHASYRAFDDEDVPATLSENISTGLLRDRLGFEGIAVTDDLGMKALPGDRPFKRICMDCLNVGADMLLICHKTDEVVDVFNYLKKNAGKRLAQDKLDIKVGRITEAKEHLWKEREKDRFREGDFKGVCREVKETFKDAV